MIDRRGFIGLMLGAAVAPKGVLQGLTTPAPVKEAIEVTFVKWVNCNERMIREIMDSLEPGVLMAMEVEVKTVGISQEEWDARQKPTAELA
jgi:hypothetical protein